MAIKIEIGANSTQVNTAQTTANTAKELAVEAKGIATNAKQNADLAISNTSALSGDIVTMQSVLDNIDKRTEGLDLEDLQQRINAAKTIGEAADEAASAADSKAAAAVAAAQAAESKAQEALDEIGSGGGIDPSAIEAAVVSEIETNYGLTQIKETVDTLGTTYATIIRVDTLENDISDVDQDLQTTKDNMDSTINAAVEAAVEGELSEYTDILEALEDFDIPDIARYSVIDDEMRTGFTDAKNSVMQEVGDMIEGVRIDAADEIDYDRIAIPTVDEENSSNESFNELMSKLQEKPMRRADVLKKVIDEDAFYWYVMPIIDQRIYRDTVVNGVIVEAGWQKAVKERFWYHKQDKDIRDNYIYLFRSDINQMIAKATEENTASNDKPQLMPLSGNPRQLRKKNELPSGIPVLGVGKKEINGRKINQTVKISTAKTTLGGLTKIPVSGKLEKATPSSSLPSWANSGKVSDILDPNNVIINSSPSALPSPMANKRKVMPYISPAEWAEHQATQQEKADLANGNYPSDFYYIACYAECDDSSMYEKGWFKLIEEGEHTGEADTTIGELIKRDNGTYYYEEWIDDSGSGSGGYYKENTVTLEHRAEFFVKRDEYNIVTEVLWRIDDNGTHDWPQAQRRNFADVSRDIKVHMLPIYLLGSTIIAIDSDDIDNDGKFNYVTIDSMISPALAETSSISYDDAPKAKKVILSGSEIQLQDSDHPNSGAGVGRYKYICRDNIRMAESGLPCVYGQGYTWLPIDAKGTADDKGGLGIHCPYTQQQMWVADGLYSYYNGLIPSGYTKETLKNLTTMYKYKIVEKFIIGEWDKNSDDTINTHWINNNYATQNDGRIDQEPDPTHPTLPNMINIFVEDYSEDNIADLNEAIFDVNIDDEYISYTIKDGMIVQDGADGGATVSNFIYDTLSYLTEKGKVNTNNIFLICVEDDGDEYIFDEYIWEKGKVLKLNEQKRIKYSEELRKIEYVQATVSKPIGQSPNQYTGGVVTGTDRDAKSEKILSYLTTITRVASGATMTNPEYIPAQEGYLTMNVQVQGRVPGEVECKLMHTTALQNAILESYVNDIMPEISATLKLATYLGEAVHINDVRTVLLAFVQEFYARPASELSIDTLTQAFSKLGNAGTKTKLSVYKPYYSNFANYRERVVELLAYQNANEFIAEFLEKNIADPSGFLYVFNENLNSNPERQETTPTYNGGGNGTTVQTTTGGSGNNTSIQNYHYLYIFDIIVYNWIYNQVSTNQRTVCGAFSYLISKMANIIAAIKDNAAAYQTLIQRESQYGDGTYGYILNSPVYNSISLKSTDVADTPASGDPTVDVMIEKRIPIQTNGTDYLQKYNKILAFLIEQNSIGENTTGYEYVYSLWRYMPTVKQYTTVGTVSIISDNVPDLNDKDTQNEVGQAGATDTHSEIANAVNVARQDIISRFDHLLTEDGILSKMPRLKGIIEQNFVSETVEGVTSYKMLNVASRDDLELAVQRQSSIETNMATLVTAVNNGNRSQFVNGAIAEIDNSPIFQATISGGTMPSVETPDAITIPPTTGETIQVQAPTSQSNSYSFNPTTSSMTRRIFV